MAQARDGRVSSNHLAALLMLAANGIPPYHVALDAEELRRLAKIADGLAEKQCSDPNWSERDEKRRERMQEKASEIAAKYGATVETGGDPRGCCLKLHGLPTIKGEEGFGVWF